MKHLPKMEMNLCMLIPFSYLKFFYHVDWRRDRLIIHFLYIIMAIILSPCSRVVEAAPYKAIVLPVIGNDVGIQLREQNLS